MNIKLTPRQAMDFFTALDIAAETARGYAAECAGSEYARTRDDIERYEDLQRLLQAAFPEHIGKLL
jgi:hypothetical protein